MCVERKDLTLFFPVVSNRLNFFRFIIFLAKRRIDTLCREFCYQRIALTMIQQ